MGDEDSVNAPSPPVTACRRCRKQKLRCSRDFPTCKRCSDIASLCEYPLPPDRKLLAAKRVQNAKARARRESENSGPSRQDQQKLPGDAEIVSSYAPSSTFEDTNASRSISYPESDKSHLIKIEPRIEEYRAPPPPLQASLKRTSLPSTEVANVLIEIYFTRQFSASLLFHKKTFLSDYAANKVPDFVALSIFALASIFLGATKGQYRQQSDEDGVDLGILMMSPQDSSKQGLEWATAGSQRVLLQADTPSLETIQACQNLTMYWFSRGQTDRAYIHTHTAYRIAKLLNLHVQRNVDGAVESTLLDELKRRCFWSCWISSCISQDNADFKNNPWQEVTDLSFPSDEESFSLGRPIPAEYFNENGDIESLSTTDFRPSPSPIGEMIKLFDLWWQIQHFVKIHKEPQSTDSPDRITTLLELDQRLGVIFDALHPDMRYQNAASLVSPKVDLYKFFSIHCLYRLNACALHTSIVPLFSETPSTPRIPKKLVRISAEESLKHAGLILDMAAVFLSARPDMSRLPNIVGYAMFVACTIHFKSLVAQRKLQQYGTGRFKAAICILEGLNEYWTINQGPWNMLKILFASKGIQVEAISKSNYRVNTSSEDRDTDVDKIVSHEGNPQESQGTDIYTYIAQITTETSPRPQSDADSTTRKSSSSMNTPSPSSIANNPVPPPERLNQVHRVANDADLRRVNPDVRTFTLPYQQHATSMSPQYPFTQSTPIYPPPLTGNPQNAQKSFSIPGGFVPMRSVAEDYQMQGHNVGVGHVPQVTGQSMDGFADAGALSSGMDIDDVNFWWDQSYGMAFEADPSQIQMTFPPDASGIYQYDQRFPFG